MATIRLTQDFKEFLRLLDSEKIEYLLIGGYGVWLYGHIRSTKDMDIWVSIAPENLDRLIEALVKFGFSRASLSPKLFQGEKSVFRMGIPPNRLEILTGISGVTFADCYARRQIMEIEGLPVAVIDYADLKKNKSSTGRLKDSADIQAIETFRKSMEPKQ